MIVVQVRNGCLGAARCIKKATGGSLSHFTPANTAGQSTERRLQLLVNPAWLEEPNLTHVAVVLFVRPDCGPRLWPQDSVNGSVVITSALQPALEFGNSGLAGIAILAIAIAVARIAVLTIAIAVAVGTVIGTAVTITIAVAVGITVTVVPVWVAVPTPPPRTPAPSPTPPPRKAEATDEDDLIVNMIRVAMAIVKMIVTVKVTPVKVAHSAAPSELTPIEAGSAPAEARAAPAEATSTAWSSRENWSSQYGRKKATQDK